MPTITEVAPDVYRISIFMGDGKQVLHDLDVVMHEVFGQV